MTDEVEKIDFARRHYLATEILERAGEMEYTIFHRQQNLAFYGNGSMYSNQELENAILENRNDKVTNDRAFMLHIDNFLLGLFVGVQCCTYPQMIRIIQAIGKNIPNIPVSQEKKDLEVLLQQRFRAFQRAAFIKAAKINHEDTTKQFNIFLLTIRGLHFLDGQGYSVPPIDWMSMYTVKSEAKILDHLSVVEIATDLASVRGFKRFRPSSTQTCMMNAYIEMFGAEKRVTCDVAAEYSSSSGEEITVFYFRFPNEDERYQMYILFSAIQFFNRESKKGSKVKLVFVCDDKKGIWKLVEYFDRFSGGKFFLKEYQNCFFSTEGLMRYVVNINKLRPLQGLISMIPTRGICDNPETKIPSATGRVFYTPVLSALTDWEHEMIGKEERFV